MFSDLSGGVKDGTDAAPGSSAHRTCRPGCVTPYVGDCECEVWLRGTLTGLESPGRAHSSESALSGPCDDRQSGCEQESPEDELKTSPVLQERSA